VTVYVRVDQCGSCHLISSQNSLSLFLISCCHAWFSLSRGPVRIARPRERAVCGRSLRPGGPGRPGAGRGGAGRCHAPAQSGVRRLIYYTFIYIYIFRLSLFHLFFFLFSFLFSLRFFFCFVSLDLKKGGGRVVSGGCVVV
jgi:hypothetical protein